MANTRTKPKSDPTLTKQQRVDSLRTMWATNLGELIIRACDATKRRTDLAYNSLITIAVDHEDPSQPSSYEPTAGLVLNKDGTLQLACDYYEIVEAEESGHFKIIPIGVLLKRLITKANIDEIEENGVGEIWKIEEELERLGNSIAP